MKSIFRILIKLYCYWRGNGQKACKAFHNCADCIGDITKKEDGK